MKHSSLVTGLVVSLALAAFACSSPATDEGPSTKSADSKTEPTTNPTPSSSSSSSSGSVTTPPTGTTGTTDDATIAACVAKGAATCGDCCDAAAPSASSAYGDARDACLCGAKGHCQTECAATECSDDDNAPDSKDGDACDTCIQKWAPEDGTGACDAALAAAITGTADGALFNKCNDACP